MENIRSKDPEHIKWPTPPKDDRGEITGKGGTFR